MNGLGEYNFLDPNNWVKDNYEFRIYGDDYASTYAVVDEIDYHYLINWNWRPKTSRIHKGTTTPKVYLCRTSHEKIGEPFVDEDGKWIRAARIQSTIFLHTVVMQRKGIPLPKTNKRIIVDHADGDGLNCRRHNLRWATMSFNAMNKYGSHEKFLV